jgi:hypothetical protein
MFSESPPLSGDKPPTNSSNSSCALHEDDEKLGFLVGGFSLLSEYPENSGICKVNLNELKYKHRSEEKRSKRIQLLNCFGKYSNVSVV